MAGKCRDCKELPAPGRKRCAEHLRYRREYMKAHYAERKDYFAQRYLNSKEQVCQKALSYRVKLRLEVIAAYGGKCACCGTEIFEFLCIDHVDENGAEHRRLIGTRAGTNFYRWLKKNNFPPGFQVLCWNCNSAKHICGICPHELGEQI